MEEKLCAIKELERKVDILGRLIDILLDRVSNLEKADLDPQNTLGTNESNPMVVSGILDDLAVEEVELFHNNEWISITFLNGHDARGFSFYSELRIKMEDLQRLLNTLSGGLTNHFENKKGE